MGWAIDARQKAKSQMKRMLTASSGSAVPTWVKNGGNWGPCCSPWQSGRQDIGFRNRSATLLDLDVRANGGCNDLRGTYTVSGKRMAFEIAIATRMSCSDEKNRADQAFGELMNRSFKAELLEPLPYRLRLTSDDGQVLVFEQLPMKL